MKLFTHEAPVSKGRVKVTVEYDAQFIREVFQLIGDAPDAVEEFAVKIIKIMAKLEKL